MKADVPVSDFDDQFQIVAKPSSQFLLDNDELYRPISCQNNQRMPGGQNVLTAGTEYLPGFSSAVLHLPATEGMYFSTYLPLLVPY